MKLDKTKEMLSQMQVVRFNAVSSEKLLTTDGKRTTASEWYDELKLTYKPAIVFFDKEGVEIIRKDAMFKEYHLHGIFSYVLSSAYIEQPNFQRYLEDKSDKLRDQGITVDIWK
jgi:thioredoxin-related protein